jgi:hypothetical protein
MLYDMKADALSTMNRADQANRIRKESHQRLVRAALVGRTKRYTNPMPGLLDWLQKLAKQEPRITVEPAS